MAIKNLKFKLHRLAVLIVIACISHYVSSAPQLPEPELSWKNVAVDGKRLLYSVFLMTAGVLCGLGLIEGYIFMMELPHILLAKTNCSARKYIL